MLDSALAHSREAQRSAIAFKAAQVEAGTHHQPGMCFAWMTNPAKIKKLVVKLSRAPDLIFKAHNTADALVRQEFGNGYPVRNVQCSMTEEKWSLMDSGW